jgi:hypothetical protein
MGALVGVVVGAGLLLIWLALSDSSDRRAGRGLRESRGRAGARFAELLRLSGAEQVSAGAVLGLCAVVGGAVAVAARARGAVARRG